MVQSLPCGFQLGAFLGGALGAPHELAHLPLRQSYFHSKSLPVFRPFFFDQNISRLYSAASLQRFLQRRI